MSECCFLVLMISMCYLFHNSCKFNIFNLKCNKHFWKEPPTPSFVSVMVNDFTVFIILSYFGLLPLVLVMCEMLVYFVFSRVQPLYPPRVKTSP